MTKKTASKVALVYDRVNTPYGGAEIVLRTLHELYPNAPLFTSVSNPATAPWAKKFKLKNSFLQHIPYLKDKHQWLVSLMPLAFETMDLSKYDIVISITSAEAKGVITRPEQLHICYLLTPTRYLYSHKKYYLNSKQLLKLPVFKQLANLFVNYLTWWDKQASMRPDVIIPISNLIKHRTKKYYKRVTAPVIYPPVELTNKGEIKKLDKLKTKPYLLSISRLVDYKRVNLSIKAALKLNRKLVIVGTGESFSKLKEIAEDNYIEKNDYENISQLLKRADATDNKIIFTGKIKHLETRTLLKNATALLMPGEEDFGITGLEASNFGIPVIVFYKSGVAELLKDNLHAVHTRSETVKELVKAIKKLDNLKFDKAKIQKIASAHTTTTFKKQFEKQVLQSFKDFSSK